MRNLLLMQIPIAAVSLHASSWRCSFDQVDPIKYDDNVVMGRKELRAVEGHV